MNILIISDIPWSTNNSFGNTFTNIFGGMQNVKIYHICCRQGTTKESLAVSTLQMTDSSALYSVLGKDAAVIFNGDNNYERPDISNIIRSRRAKDKIIFHIVRDVIWKFGGWKRSILLDEFLKKSGIDIVYLPIYASWHMCDVQMYIISRLRVPVVAHITDDVYQAHPQGERGLLESFYRDFLQKKICATISKCSYIEVFAENMMQEYRKLFKKKCYVIGKGIKPNEVPRVRNTSNNSNIIVYSGGLGADRYKVIARLARSIDDSGASFRIHIYSPDAFEGNIKKAFEQCKCVKYRGFANSESLKKIQRRAGYLLHVESFSPKMIDAVRMSFSTKIIDYMMTGNPIIAIGPSVVNSIAVLKERKVAIVADKVEDINAVVDNLIMGNVELDELFCRSRQYLIEEHNINVIQDGMQERMNAICKTKGKM